MKPLMNPEYTKNIHPTQGNYIVAPDRTFEKNLELKAIKLDSISVEVGKKTTLHGWFSEALVFCGFIGDWAVFYLGESQGDLFNKPVYYYDATLIIDHDRIGKSYAPRTFRDSWLRCENGTFYWK